MPPKPAYIFINPQSNIGLLTSPNSGLLIMAAMTYLCPEFIKEGRLCWLRAPLYIVEQKNGKEEYFFTDEEYNKVRGKIKGEVHRNKGLGEMSAESAHASMFVEENQRLDVMEYNADAIYLLSELMGTDADFRREYIFENVDFSEVTE